MEKEESLLSKIKTKRFEKIKKLASTEKMQLQKGYLDLKEEIAQLKGEIRALLWCYELVEQDSQETMWGGK